MVFIFVGLFYNIVDGLISESKGENKTGQSGSSSVFCDLDLKLKLHLTWHILMVPQISLTQYGEGHKSVNARRPRFLGAILVAAYHTLYQAFLTVSRI